MDHNAHLIVLIILCIYSDMGVSIAQLQSGFFFGFKAFMVRSFLCKKCRIFLLLKFAGRVVVMVQWHRCNAMKKHQLVCKNVLHACMQR